MQRQDLLDKLTTVAPALAANEIIPVLTHIWFTGSRVMAYNDRIGISVPLKTEFKGAIPGDLTISFLKASRSDEVILEGDAKDLRIKAGSAKLDLAIMAPDAFSQMFKMPALGKDKGSDLSKEFLSALDDCMRSVSSDTSVPDQLGITLIPDKSDLNMFATSNQTLSHAVIGGKELPLSSRAILPASFCEQLIALTKGEDSAVLEVNQKENYALAEIGNVFLFGRLIESEQPINFFRILDDHMPSSTKKQFIEIPAQLETILEHATILTEAERTPTKISVKDGKMEFYSKSDLHGHELHDTMKVKGHPDLDEVQIDAKLLKLGYGAFEEILITSRCAIMAKGDRYYLVASRGK